MAVIEQPAKKFVASLFTACVVVGSWWGEQKGLGRLLRKKRHWCHSCVSTLPNGNGWDQESVIVFVRVSSGLILLLCCHK